MPFRDGPPHVPNWHAFRMGIHERTGQVDGVARPEGLAPLTLGAAAAPFLITTGVEYVYRIDRQESGRVYQR